MRIIPLQSGSNGNCIYLESWLTSVLVDAGISAKCAAARLARFGRNVEQIDAVLITHEHDDHIRCAGVFARKMKAPVYMSHKTYGLAQRTKRLGVIPDLRLFHPGETLTIGDLRVQSIPTPHDAFDGSVFVFDDGRRRIGLFTDLGHVFQELKDVFATLDGALIESNYDEQMLATGPYPFYLKRRISGPAGHISNLDAAELLRDCTSPRLQWACLAHLSAENNSEAAVLETHGKVLGHRFPLTIAKRHEEGDPLEV